MIIALAGRRIDADQTDTPRFPLAHVALVRQRLSQWFTEHDVQLLVCSAACGADLLALTIAQELGVQTLIVLPFPQPQFRATSVVDRGEEWGAAFDAVIAEAEEQGNVIDLGYKPEDDTAFVETNLVIIELALSQATQLNQSVQALLVWDGASRGEDDITAEFQTVANQRGLSVHEILTI